MASLLHHFALRFAKPASAACFTCSPGASVCRSARSNLSDICSIIRLLGIKGLAPAVRLPRAGRRTERSGDGQILNRQSMPLPPALLPSEARWLQEHRPR